MKAMANIIEAVISAMIILSAMLFLFNSAPIQDQDIYETAYNCLIYSKDTMNMETSFRQCLPSTYNFCFGDCIGSLPSGATVVSVEYIDSGPELIKVWVYK